MKKVLFGVAAVLLGVAVLLVLLYVGYDAVNKNGLKNKNTDTCPKGGCDQRNMHKPTCYGGYCDQTSANMPTCYGGYCDQTSATTPTCYGGYCRQTNTQTPSCIGGLCLQTGASNPTHVNTCTGGNCTISVYDAWFKARTQAENSWTAGLPAK
jgi:hypothetical protein